MVGIGFGWVRWITIMPSARPLKSAARRTQQTAEIGLDYLRNCSFIIEGDTTLVIILFVIKEPCWLMAVVEEMVGILTHSLQNYFVSMAIAN